MLPEKKEVELMLFGKLNKKLEGDLELEKEARSRKRECASWMCRFLSSSPGLLIAGLLDV